MTRSRWNASASSVASRRWPKWIGSKVPPKRPRGAVVAFAAKSAAHVAVAQHDPLLRGEAFEPNRPAGVELVGGDADLRPEAVFVAVGEARGGIHHHGAGIDFPQEALRPAPVLRHDGVGVLRAVFGDVRDGFV